MTLIPIARTPRLLVYLLPGLLLISAAGAADGKRVTFESGQLTLVGFLYRVQAAFRQQGSGEANRLTVRLLETEQLDDQLAALSYLRRLPVVDRQRIVVAGCSYGGIQALLAAESAGYRAAVSVSPAALSWDRNDWLKARLVKAVGRTGQAADGENLPGKGLRGGAGPLLWGRSRNAHLGGRCQGVFRAPPAMTNHSRVILSGLL